MISLYGIERFSPHELAFELSQPQDLIFYHGIKVKPILILGSPDMGSLYYIVHAPIGRLGLLLLCSISVMGWDTWFPYMVLGYFMNQHQGFSQVKIHIFIMIFRVSLIPVFCLPILDPHTMLSRLLLEGLCMREVMLDPNRWWDMGLGLLIWCQTILTSC